MDKNTLVELNGSIYRILLFRDNKIYVINCSKMIMPEAINKELLDKVSIISEEKLWSITCFKPLLLEELSDNDKNVIHSKYALIMPVLAFIDDEILRSEMIDLISKKSQKSKSTIRRYLIRYLVYNTKTALANTHKYKELSQDEKNFRWALNKFYYTRFKKSLSYAYKQLLRNKYLDEEGKLIEGYPKYHQFRYFFSKYNKKEKEIVSREGLGKFKRDYRELLGTIYNYAPNVGIAMLDSTIVDIYLVDDNGNVIGRPVLTAAVDAYSGMCLGYSLSWEGGIYSLEQLMLNIIENKVEHCRKYGIIIEQEKWDVKSLPAVMLSDKGREYVSDNFSQLTDLGIQIINLPPFRPELKGRVEKFFDIVQNLYKENICKSGLIYEDYNERGSHDYRKDAVFTLEQFNKILLNCIITYNNSTIIDVPYDSKMIEEKIEPFPSSLWNYQIDKFKDNFIDVDSNTLLITLLPRSKGRFTRKGLIFNKLRYRNDDFKEEYLQGGNVTISYNPDNATKIYVRKNNKWHEFSLISSEYDNLSFEEIDSLIDDKSRIIKQAREKALLEKVKLSNQIETITSQIVSKGTANIKNIREIRNVEKKKTHSTKVIGGNDNNG